MEELKALEPRDQALHTLDNELHRQFGSLEDTYNSLKSEYDREQAALAEAGRQRRLDQEAGRESYRVARARELDQAQRGRDIQSVSSDGQITAKVKAGWSRDHNMPCTDIVIDQQGFTRHHHIVIGEDGQIHIDEWRY